jgi:hypothetical protein
LKGVVRAMPAGRLRAVSEEEGSALVEGAILMPLLFVLIFGVYEFSWFFYQQHVATIGVRDAARYLARVGNPCDAESPLWANAQMHAKELATTGSIGGNTPRIKGWSSAMVTLHCAPIDNPIGSTGLSAYRGGQIVYLITASSRFIDPSLGFFSLLRLVPPTISVSHSERAIGRG